MPFTIEVEADETLKQLDELQKKITDLHQEMPQTLVDWQREDMHRHFPNIETSGSDTETTAETSIWPRSRQSDQRKPGPSGTAPRRPRPKMAVPAGQRAPSQRPILRPELFVKLHDRMVDMIKKALTWA
jgi:hypothetical protein